MQGRWGAYSTASELEGLMASLERRGVRELALAEVGWRCSYHHQQP